MIPVIVRDCDWQTAPFAELQTLPTGARAVAEWKSTDAAWTNVAKGLRGVIADRFGHPLVPFTEYRGREPRYADNEIRRLSLQLKALYQSRKNLSLAGSSTVEIEREIIDVCRLLRKGPQLRAGEFLDDGRIELFEPVGQGGFATVWSAWDADAEALVAIKVLHGHLSDDRSKRERFFRGSRKMAELAHPHIVRLLTKELSDDGWSFFVMEYVRGGNFEQAVLDRKLSLAERLELLLQVGDALSYAHKRGVVHRDVKPSNILLDERGEAKLTDFDLVRAQDTTGLTATRAMMGTVHFAAPEALTSAKEVGPAADIYSLGTTVVFAVSGSPLPSGYFRDPGKTIGGLGCGPKLQGILLQATAFEPTERYPSIREFCRALQASIPSSDQTLKSEDPRAAEASHSTPFGDYTLLDRFAHGSMAEVWRARRRGVEGFEKTVAIKKMHAHLTGSAEFVKMLINEAKLAAQLNHTNIIQIYDLGKVDADFFIAMEYVEGKDLRSILSVAKEKNSPLPIGLTLLVVDAVARALDYAHRKRDVEGRELGLVHRDIAPHNVLVSYQGEIKLCDFGIAKAASTANSKQMGVLEGKLEYMSPEQAWGRSVDARSDIFSLGSVFFELLTGHKRFAGQSEIMVLDAVRECRPRSPLDLEPSIPKEVESIVCKALAKNPDDRYQRVGKMLQDIKSMLDSIKPTPDLKDLAEYMHGLFRHSLKPAKNVV